ncbi:unnamed protein product [Parnassius mnemosyne]|uniref:Uncharacterized protein n=1 Tax=Parnassius mnemosyne TaxID=213953 RepID=A0AAV1KTV4_9NEOP
MLAHSTLLIFVAVFQISTSQGPPPLPPNLPKECLQPPPVDNPRKCCDIPPIFRDEDFQGCGFKKVNEGMPDVPRGPPECSKQICLLKTRNLVKDDDTIDREAVSKFMDTWAEPYPEFKPTVESAKEKCLGGELPGPPEICDANKMVFCMSSILFMECPKWKNELEDCRALKNQIDTCEKYFPH